MAKTTVQLDKFPLINEYFYSPESEVWEVKQIAVIILGGCPCIHIKVSLQDPFS